jgi:hypothetical protein
MLSFKDVLQKVGVILVYALLWLGCFQIKEIILTHTIASFQKIIFCLAGGLLFAYINRFQLFKNFKQNKKT